MSNSFRWDLRTVSDNSGAECDHVRGWLREHNWAANPEFMRQLQELDYHGETLNVLAESGGCVVGGIFAETVLKWLRIPIMAVHPAHRSRGVGSDLLAEAERQAVARGCAYSYVDTMSYQAPNFYQDRGYQIVGEIPDWDSHSHSKYYLTKSLIHRAP
jgi:GNAT superfamily N-acetyltransferase